MFGHLKDAVAEASVDIDEIQKYYIDELPENQQGYPQHLEKVAEKLEQLIPKYPAKADVLQGAVAVLRDLATPDWMKDLTEMSGGRRRTSRKTRKVPSLRVLQKENFQLRKKLGTLSSRDMQPDEAYNLNSSELKKQRKEFTKLITTFKTRKTRRV